MSENKKIGKRILLIKTNDKYTNLKSGDKGTISFIDSMDTIHVNWDNGSNLGLIPGQDEYVILDQLIKDGDENNA